MKRIVALIGLSVGTVLANTWADSSGSPVGTWEIKKPDGFAFFTFEDDGAVTGYGGGARSFGLVNVTGSGTGPDGDFPIVGHLLLGSQSRGFVYLGEQTNTVSQSLAGKFNTLTGTARLRGRDSSRHSVKAHFIRQ